MPRTFDIHALLDDGTVEWDRCTPLNTGRPLATALGASLALRVKVVRPNGVPVNLDGLTVHFSMKQSTEQVETWPGLSLDGVNDANCATNGLSLVTIDWSSTRDFVPGRYVYDVWLIDPAPDGDRTQVVATSAFILTPVVTRNS
jgi:hypothetical protein